MQKIFCTIILIITIYFIAMPTFYAIGSNGDLSKTQTRMFNLNEIFEDNNITDKNKENIRLKMLTRIVAGVVLIVGILSTIAVQFKIINIGLGAVSEKPETLGGLIILMLLPESIVLLSFVISILLILM